MAEKKETAYVIGMTPTFGADGTDLFIRPERKKAVFEYSSIQRAMLIQK
jgi:hypothetical protein